MLNMLVRDMLCLPAATTSRQYGASTPGPARFFRNKIASARVACHIPTQNTEDHMRVKCHTRNRGYDAVSQPRPRGAALLRDEGGLEPGYAISLLAAEGDSRSVLAAAEKLPLWAPAAKT